MSKGGDLTTPMTRLIQIITFLSRLFGVVAAGFMAVSVVVVCEEIVQRSVLGGQATWQNEFVTYAIVAATFLGSPYVLLTRGHVNVDVVPLYLGQRGRFALALVSALLALVFCAVIGWTSLDWWQDLWRSGETKSSIWSPRIWIPALSVPVGFGLLVLQYVADLWCLASGREPPFGLALRKNTDEAPEVCEVLAVSLEGARVASGKPGLY